MSGISPVGILEQHTSLTYVFLKEDSMAIQFIVAGVTDGNAFASDNCDVGFLRYIL